MIKIEFPSNRTDIALAIGKALVEIGGGTVATRTVETTVSIGDKSHTEKITEPCGTCEGQDVVNGQCGGDCSAYGDKPDQDLDLCKVDQKGVVFDPEFCGNAAKPFYESGPREGQWKKRKGVGDSYYDEWYAEELAKGTHAISAGTTATNTSEEEPPIDVGAALAGQQATPQAEIPANGGELMQWVSEKQTAGLLTPDDVQAAYTALGIDVPALFGPEGGKHAPAIHAILVQKAGQ